MTRGRRPPDRVRAFTVDTSKARRVLRLLKESPRPVKDDLRCPAGFRRSGWKGRVPALAVEGLVRPVEGRRLRSLKRRSGASSVASRWGTSALTKGFEPLAKAEVLDFHVETNRSDRKVTTVPGSPDRVDQGAHQRPSGRLRAPDPRARPRRCGPPWADPARAGHTRCRAAAVPRAHEPDHARPHRSALRPGGARRAVRILCEGGDGGN